MIDKIEDLNLTDNDTKEEICEKIKNSLGVEVDSLIDELSLHVKNSADEISGNFVNIVPYGDYDRYTDDKLEIAKFLKEEAYEKKNWFIYSIGASDVKASLIHFIFFNKSIDDGLTFQGNIYVNFSGKIKHIFTQVE